MQLWAEFTEKGRKFEAFLPSNNQEDLVWTLRVTGQDGVVVNERIIPLNYRPIFGPDVSDVDILNAVVEEEVAKLP